jgi:hypothetical protein
MKDTRIAGWSGIVFSILSLIVIPLVVTPPQPPPFGAPAADFAAWYAAHHWGFLAGNFLGMAAFFPGLVQLAVLTAQIRRAEGEGGWLGLLVGLSGTFAYAIFFASLAVFQALPFLSGAALDAVVTVANLWFALDGLAAVPLALAVGWAVTRTGVFPRWFATFTWVVAAVALVMSLGGLFTSPAWLAGGGPATFLGFVVAFVWTFVLAVLQLRQ